MPVITVDPVASRVLTYSSSKQLLRLAHGDRETVPTVLLTLKSITVQGSFVGTLDELNQLVSLAKAGALPQIPIIEGQLNATEIDAALDRLGSGGVPGRIVLAAGLPVS